MVATPSCLITRNGRRGLYTIVFYMYFRPLTLDHALAFKGVVFENSRDHYFKEIGRNFVGHIRFWVLLLMQCSSLLFYMESEYYTTKSKATALQA